MAYLSFKYEFRALRYVFYHRYDEEEYLDIDPLTGERGPGSYNPDDHYGPSAGSPGTAGYYGTSPNPGASRASERPPRDSSTPVNNPAILINFFPANLSRISWEFRSFPMRGF